MILITAGYAGEDFIEGFMRKANTTRNAQDTPDIADSHSLAPIDPFGHEEV